VPFFYKNDDEGERHSIGSVWGDLFLLPIVNIAEKKNACVLKVFSVVYR